MHNTSNDDGRPRPIAAVVVIEPDDGHVMSRVVPSTEIDDERYLTEESPFTCLGTLLDFSTKHARALVQNISRRITLIYVYPIVRVIFFSLLEMISVSAVLIQTSRTIASRRVNNGRNDKW